MDTKLAVLVMPKALGLAFLGLMASMAAKADDVFRPYVSLSVSRDSNVFRLDDATNPTLKRSDALTSLAAGVNVSLQPGRQNINLTLGRTLTRYDRLEQLDFDGEDYRLDWRWQLTNRFSGNVGVSRTVSQTSFTDFVFSSLSFAQFNNLITRDRINASAEWWFHPVWRARLSAASGKQENNTQQFRAQNVNDQVLELGVSYTTPKGSQLQALMALRDIEYPNRILNSFSRIDKEYTQKELSLLGTWAVSAKLSSRLRLGYTEREGKNLAVRDYSGLSYRGSFDYAPTAKTRVTVMAYRDVSGVELDNSNFRLINGLSLSGGWQISSHYVGRTGVIFENNDYRSDSSLSQISPVRDEDIYSLFAGIAYSPLSNISIDLSVQAGTRDSSLENANYKFFTTTASLRADF